MQQIVDKIATKAVRAFHLPVLAVGLWYQGKSFFSFSGKGAGKTVNEQTVFPIGSASKAFISAAIMQLSDEGKLRLDDPVVRHMPDFALSTPERTAQLTIRDMLCHRCGLPRHDVTLFTRPDIPLSEMVYNIRYLEPVWPIGQRFCYQNHMFAAASELVGRVTGIPWGDYVRQNVFGPLEMNRSYTQSQQYEHVDQNYAVPKLGIGPFNIPTKNLGCDSTGAAGAISASTGDLLAWAAANLHQGVGDTAVVYSKSAADELHSPQMKIRPGEITPYQLPEVTNTAYGLGWFVEQYRGEKLVHHGGTITGFKSLVGFMPEHEMAFVILTNRNGTQAPVALGYSLCDMVLGSGTDNWNKRFKEIAARRSQAAKQALQEQRSTVVKAKIPSDAFGSYCHRAYGELRFHPGRGGMRMDIGGFSVPVRATQTGILIDAGLMGMAFPGRFERDPDGRMVFYAKLEQELSDYIRFEPE